MGGDPDGRQSVGGHRSPGRLRRRNAEPKKTKKRLEEDGRGHAERGLHDDRSQRIGKDVTEQDLEGLGSAGPRRLDELALAKGKRLPAHQARHVHPAGHRDGDDDLVQTRVAKQYDQQQRDQQVGNAVEDVDDEAHDRVEPALEVTGGQADRYANR